MTAVRAPWILRDAWRDYELRTWRAGADGRAPLAPVAARAVLEQAARDDWARSVLVRFHAEELGGGLQRPSFDVVLRELRSAVERGWLAIIALEREVSALEGDREEKEEKEEESPELSWVHVVVKDEDGEPVSGLRFRLQLPDGSVREGTTDSYGAVKVSDVTAGTCRVSFPGLDESSVTQKS